MLSVSSETMVLAQSQHPRKAATHLHLHIVFFLVLRHPLRLFLSLHDNPNTSQTESSHHCPLRNLACGTASVSGPANCFLSLRASHLLRRTFAVVDLMDLVVAAVEAGLANETHFASIRRLDRDRSL